MENTPACFLIGEPLASGSCAASGVADGGAATTALGGAIAAAGSTAGGTTDTGGATTALGTGPDAPALLSVPTTEGCQRFKPNASVLNAATSTAPPTTMAARELLPALVAVRPHGASVPVPAAATGVAPLGALAGSGKSSAFVDKPAA